MYLVTFTLISILATENIQKRRGQALLFSFEYNIWLMKKTFFSFRLIGPITSKLATFYVFLVKLFFSLIPQTLSEMMLVKCLYILKWSSMAMADDNLIATVIFRYSIYIRIVSS